MFTIGCDPEVLLKHGEMLVSAIGHLPGTKHEPVDTDFGRVHTDNVAAEFNTPPVMSAEDFDLTVGRALDGIGGMIASSGFTVSTESVGEFSEDQLAHPQAREAGCEPDYDAYTDGKMRIPPMLWDTQLRCAGGHIHIGMEGLSKEDIHRLVKCLDLLVTVPMLKYENPTRRQLYGGAGAYRPKPYGLEYRCPSNFWVFTSERRRWVYSMVEKAVKSFRDMILPEGIQEVINSHDVEAAEALVTHLDLTPCPN